MNKQNTLDREKVRKDLAKKAVAFAMKNRWSEAANLNRAMLKDFPEDLETLNRLGKALSELGRNKEAKETFHNVLQMYPHNSIARKNLDRLARLGDDDITQLPSPPNNKSASKVFIEESGKSGVTSLLDLATPQLLVKLTPGHVVTLEIQGSNLNVKNASGDYIGRVEPKAATRLIRLMSGGNKYEATVTSSNPNELLIIVRETYKHPTQANIVSFPLRNSGTNKIYTSNAMLDIDEMENESVELGELIIKDWSDDDTEPGDDDAFSPVFHRIINSADEDGENDY